MNFGVCAFGRIDDFRCALIEHCVVVGLHADTNNFLCWTSHGKTPSTKQNELNSFSVSIGPQVHLFCATIRQRSQENPVGPKKASEKALFRDFFRRRSHASRNTADGATNLRIATTCVNRLRFCRIPRKETLAKHVLPAKTAQALGPGTHPLAAHGTLLPPYKFR